MINTQLFQMLVLLFKIFSYTSSMTEAEVDMLNYGVCNVSFSYAQTDNVLSITPFDHSTAKKQEAMTIITIDNGLYKVKLPGGDEFELDMAPLYTQLDWDSFGSGKMLIKSKDSPDLVLSFGKDTIFLSNQEGTTFSLSWKYIPEMK